MALTSAQKTTLKNHITASSDLNVFDNNDDGNAAIKALLDLAASPAFIVWKTSLGKHDVTDKQSPTGSLFSWTGYIARSQGERDAWDQLWNSSLTCNPSLSQVRQGFADIFSGGTTDATNNKNHMLAMAKRSATRFEKLFTTGTGTDATPGLIVVEGPVTVRDIEEARNS